MKPNVIGVCTRDEQGRTHFLSRATFGRAYGLSTCRDIRDLARRGRLRYAPLFAS